MTAAAYEAFRAQPTACGADAPSPATSMQFDEPGDAGLDGPARVELETSCGVITIELDPEAAPEAANSFLFLAEEGYFDGTAVHRVVPGSFVQAGDPTASARGGPGYLLPDELPAPDTLYTRGMVAMANAGPDTAGSQFFIMLADLALPPAYTIFGRVVAGFDALDALADVPLGPGAIDSVPSRPLETIYLERVRPAGD